MIVSGCTTWSRVDVLYDHWWTDCMTVSGLVSCTNISEKIAGWPLTKPNIWLRASFLLTLTNRPHIAWPSAHEPKEIFLEQIPLRLNRGEHNSRKATFGHADFFMLEQTVSGKFLCFLRRKKLSQVWFLFLCYPSPKSKKVQRREVT